MKESKTSVELGSMCCPSASRHRRKRSAPPLSTKNGPMDKEELEALQKKVGRPRMSQEERIKKQMGRMHRSLEKHFGVEDTQLLKSTTGWDLFSNDLFTDEKLLRQIAAVNLKLPGKATAVRALYEGIDQAPVDETTKKGYRHRLQGMVDNLKEHSAYEVIFEVAMGGHPFPIDAEKAILLLEKMAHNLHSDEEE